MSVSCARLKTSGSAAQSAVACSMSGGMMAIANQRDDRHEQGIDDEDGERAWHAAAPAGEMRAFDPPHERREARGDEAADVDERQRVSGDPGDEDERGHAKDGEHGPQHPAREEEVVLIAMGHGSFSVGVCITQAASAEGVAGRRSLGRHVVERRHATRLRLVCLSWEFR